jgi:hypothetical protein
MRQARSNSERGGRGGACRVSDRNRFFLCGRPTSALASRPLPDASLGILIPTSTDVPAAAIDTGVTQHCAAR